jgi:hypothetical protein
LRTELGGCVGAYLDTLSWDKSIAEEIKAFLPR